MDNKFFNRKRILLPNRSKNILFLFCFFSIMLSQPDSLGNTTVNFGGAGHAESGQMQTDVIIGDPFIGTTTAANGTMSSDAGQWSFYLLPPEAPTVLASDGDFPEMIYLSWSLDILSPPATGQTKIYKNSSTNPDIIAPGIDYFEDENNLDPGMFYTYDVIVTNYYNESSVGSDVGFINPNGKILGRVTSTTGNPVADVEISLSPTLGNALEFDGVSDYLEVGGSNDLGITDEITIEAWVFVDSTITESRIGNIIGNYNHSESFNLEGYTNGRVRFYWNMGDVNIYSTGFDMRDSQWHHIAAVRSSTENTISLYIDGQLNNETTAGSNINPSWPLRIGDDFRSGDSPGIPFNGKLDDIRIWSVALDSGLINRNMNRTLSGSETGLLAYWKFDEGNNDYIFDMTEFDNDGRVFGATWTNIIPEINVSGFTDDDGNYEVSGIFYGTGTTFTVSPSKPNHDVWNPTNRQVAMDDENRLITGIDFTDESMLSVSGTVQFNNTSCFVEGVEILVDGESYVPRAYTDENGSFNLDFEPGASHTLSANYHGHTFSPADGISFQNLLQPLAGRQFFDTQTQSLEISVQGGTCGYPIGRFGLIVSSANNCFTETDTTSTIGYKNFLALPAMDYTVSLTAIDSVPINDDENFDKNHSISLVDSSQTLRVTWFAPLQIEVSGLTDHPIGVPVVQMNQFYPLTVDVFEQYGSNRCNINSGTVSILDAISNSADNFSFFDSTGYGQFAYTLIPYVPNITAGGGEHDYQMNATFTVTDEQGRDQNTTLWVITEGERPRVTTFESTSPDIPFLVIHDPPGDGSYSYFSNESALETSIGFALTESENFESHMTLSLGQDVSIGVGIGPFSASVDIDQTLDFYGSMEVNSSQTNAFEQTWSISTTETYTTTNDDQVVGDGSDIFIGGAINILYGITDVLVVEDTTNNAIEDYDVNIYQSIIVLPDGFATTYMYTENHVINTVIPDLLENLHDTTSADQWQTILSTNTANKDSAEFVENISFNSGVNREYTKSFTTSSTNSYEFEFELGGTIGMELGMTVGGQGLVGGTSYTMAMTIGSSESTTQTNTTTTGYVLFDDDETSDLNNISDDFALDVLTDPVYGTPVFDLVSGNSSCPWEQNTVPREGVQLLADQYSAVDIMPGEQAVFSLYLGNTSQTEEDRRTYLSVVQSSNPYGALISINGVPIEDDMIFDIPGTIGENSIQTTLTVDRGPNAYDYAGLEIHLGSGCEPLPGIGSGTQLFHDFKSFDVHFVPPCSNIDILTPENNWVINNGNNDTLEIILNDFDTEDQNIELFKVEYAEIESNDWFPATEIEFDSVSGDWVRLYWDVSSLADGSYKIRARSECTLMNEYSADLTGVIDRQSPQVLGNPEPSDGMLGITDEISIQFEEHINCDLLTPDNFTLSYSSSGNEVAIQWSCYENTLYIEPDIQNSYIENQLLRMTLEGIQDLNGNTISEPQVWEFVVNRNPIGWNNTNVDLIAFTGEENNFSTTLINIGSSPQTFELTNLPAWLMASPMAGEINPGGSFDISFVIDPSINNGDYYHTLFADCPEGMEPLNLDIIAMCPFPEWSLNAFNFQYSMNITAQLSIMGDISNDIYDRVGAFVGDELRGVAELIYDDALDTCLAYLTVYSNQFTGEEITFHIWDRTGCMEFWGTDSTVIFADDSFIGSPTNPFLINATGTIAQNITIQSGFTWFSLNLESAVASDLNAVFDGFVANDGDRIIGHTSYAQYQGSTSNWVGTLAEEGIRTSHMYIADFDSLNMLDYIGYPIIPDTSAILINDGWTWLGYLPHENIDVNVALSSMESTESDLIKDQFNYAQYVDNIGWVGSLTRMFPGKGYKLYTDTYDTLIYPNNDNSRDDYNAPSLFEQLNSFDPDSLPVEVWIAQNVHSFEHNMTITALIDDGDYGLNDPYDMIVAMVEDEVRGIARPLYIPILDQYRIFLSINSNSTENENMEIRIWDNDEETIYKGAEILTFNPDDMIGSVVQPLIIQKTLLGIGDEGFIPEEFMLSQNYPNPFNPITKIGFGVPEISTVNIIIYDIMGRQIKTLLNNEMEPGYQVVIWNGTNQQSKPVSSGMYFVVMEGQGLTKNFRDVKKMMMLK